MIDVNLLIQHIHARFPDLFDMTVYEPDDLNPERWKLSLLFRFGFDSFTQISIHRESNHTLLVLDEVSYEGHWSGYHNASAGDNIVSILDAIARILVYMKDGDYQSAVSQDLIRTGLKERLGMMK